MNCLSCSAETTNGLALCEACRATVTVYLEFIPVYFRNLARWQPGQAGSRAVPSSKPPRGAFNPPEETDRVYRALSAAGNDLATWSRCLADDRGVELPETDAESAQVAALCLLLNRHLTSVSTLEWAGEFVTGLRRHEHALRGLTMAVAPGWYAGACRHCESPTFVVPGLTWVSCDGCGATTYARDHLDLVIEEASDWVARPMRLAEACVALVDTELSVPRLYERIKKWGTREQIPAYRRTEYAPKTYRFGDVLDRLAVDGETRLEPEQDGRITA